MKRGQPVGSSERREFAFELKYKVPEVVAAWVLEWARRRLEPDPNAGGDGHDGYMVNSVYLDTPDLDVYHRKGSHGRCKYRVRRYGEEAGVFLERKMKTRGQVGKRRTRVGEEEVAMLAAREADRDWRGWWFHRRLLLRDLTPKCQIAYDRVARVGAAPEGPIRLTMDRNLRCFPSDQWQVHRTGPWRPLLDRECIIEMKYRVAVPTLFKEVIQQLQLVPQAVSKYRMTVEAFGWGAPAKPLPEASASPAAQSEAGVVKP
jgi:VTC domain